MARAVRIRRSLSVRLVLTGALSAAILGYGIQPVAAGPARTEVTASAVASAEELPDEGSPGQGEPADRAFDDFPGTQSPEGGALAGSGAKAAMAALAEAGTTSTASAPTISRSRVIERAKSWVGLGLAYN
ncbi:hypothetical protein [Streptomyces xanthophaeus]|uniref:hypothetical protein n=1 Tax=Streptomyces xanthophaeus TaxID=67385 RepID=UPI0037172100